MSPEEPSMNSTAFQLFLFATDKTLVVPAIAAGVNGIVIDWESKGKHRRQEGADTQIGTDTPEDLQHVRSLTDAPIICRINPNIDLAECEQEINLAIDHGADEILLPMVRTAAQVESVLDVVQGRCHVGILIETMAAVNLAAALGGLPLKRVYVGLNDLAIDRRKRNIFSAIADGTVDAVREHIPMPFGYAGLTLPDKGFPIPAHYLYNEMARLDCSFTFLRRSFLRDTQGKDLDQAVPAMRAALEEAFQTPAIDRKALHLQLADHIQNMNGTLYSSGLPA